MSKSFIIESQARDEHGAVVNVHTETWVAGMWYRARHPKSPSHVQHVWLSWVYARGTE